MYYERSIEATIRNVSATFPVLFWNCHGGSAYIVRNVRPCANRRRLEIVASSTVMLRSFYARFSDPDGKDWATTVSAGLQAIKQLAHPSR